MRTDVANPNEPLLNDAPHGHTNAESVEILAGERRGEEARLTVGVVGGQALRWMGSAGGAVLAIGAAAACCGGVSLGLVGLAAGVAGVAAGLGAVVIALVSAILIGTASIARRRRSLSGAACSGSRLRAEHRRESSRSTARE
jgi:hypothetical protein